MIFTGVLGAVPLGQLVLGALPEVDDPFHQFPTSVLILTQSATVETTLNVSAENTLTLTDEAFKVVDGEAEDTLTITDEATFEKYKQVASTSTLTLSQSSSASKDIVREMNQPLVLTQAATRKMYFARPVSNTLALSQSASCTVSRHSSNTLVYSQLAEYVYSKGARNTLEIGQTIARLVTYVRPLFSNFLPFQTLTREATFRRDLNSIIYFTQAASCTVIKAARNTFAPFHTASCYIAKAAFDELEFTDSASQSHTSNVSASSLFLMDSEATVNKTKFATAQSVFAPNQFARGNRILHASASNMLVFNDELVADYFDETPSNTLTLSQSATVQKIVSPSASNTLVLSHALTLSKTIVRSVANTLVFKSSFDKRTGIASFPIVSVPNAQVVVTKRKCFMLLQYGTNSITLPCPEFNDTEGNVIRLNVKRSMNAVRRVYKRDNPTSTLHYDLVMDRLKAIELRNFILANNSNPLRLQNFKGELWIVQLTNSPFTFVEDAARFSPYGNRSTISLDFEGVRIN